MKSRIISAAQRFITYSPVLTFLRQEAFENIVGKGENVDNQHFLVSSQCFEPY